MRIVLVDDHAVVRDGLRMIFEMQDGWNVVGEASDGEAALRVIAETKPDIVLMDLSMPGMTGMEALRALKNAGDATPVVVLTTYRENHLIAQAMALGAKGYLTKDAARAELIRTVEAAVRGETLMKPEIVQALMAGAAGASGVAGAAGVAGVSHATAPTGLRTMRDAVNVGPGTMRDAANLGASGFPSDASNPSSSVRLSERERFVLRAIARGCTSREISIDMDLSERTVKSHLTSIYGKLGVESRAEAVAEAIRLGLVRVG